MYSKYCWQFVMHHKLCTCISYSQNCATPETCFLSWQICYMHVCMCVCVCVCSYICSCGWGSVHNGLISFQNSTTTHTYFNLSKCKLFMMHVNLCGPLQQHAPERGWSLQPALRHPAEQVAHCVQDGHWEEEEATGCLWHAARGTP